MKYREKYLRRARIAGKILRWVPFLRMAGLNGSIVRGEETESSDIDFLIIAKSGRLYTARAFATFFIALTGYRRHGNKIAGRICLNCYLPDTKPDITPNRLAGGPKSRQKIALSNKYLIALVDSGSMEKKFFKTNKWLNKFEVKGAKYAKSRKADLVPRWALKPINLFEPILSGKLGDFFEKKLMRYQVKRIKRGVRRGDETVATTKEIRLHPKK